MFGKILAGGLIGGLAGGIAVAAIQAVTTTPLILHAETFEVAQSGVHTALNGGLLWLAHGPAHGTAGEGAGNDLTRLFSTSIMTCVVAVGYAWMLLAAMWVKGEAITARAIVPWAIAGFIATGLAPALGLAPELPGAAYVDLGARQLWWAGTAIATAAALACFAFGRNGLWMAAGLMLLVLPHLIGAPHTEETVSRVPAELAAAFASASLVVQALVWIVPAVLAGFFVSRMTAD
ncbi:CbtA family protein [Rhodoligotrophos defluvii]|uniref:CbtA family protein n=1 Tax=Rhodoligotrophos defluvii TaxID=2561934 RepID=UPI0010C9F8E1|nr:CbtA family protein [Rhodoligotrophos defluvii]